MFLTYRVPLQQDFNLRYFFVDTTPRDVIGEEQNWDCKLLHSNFDKIVQIFQVRSWNILEYG